ncbi:MAG: hypothetical protein LBT32_06940, partial [Peptococcaceae bacterium]|nr:hypothetical protein [Peptococcaceae bacterium]
MGQYFIPVNITKKEAIARNVRVQGVQWSEVIGLLKMMETAYVLNTQVMCVLGKLQDEWFGDAIVWAGDYEDVPESGQTLYSVAGDEGSDYIDVTTETLGYAPWYHAVEAFEASHYGSCALPELTDAENRIELAIRTWYADKALVNLDRKCYIHLGENARLTAVAPLPLLTSTRADGEYIDGGRYSGVNIDLMGAWKGQRIGVLPAAGLEQPQYSGFVKWDIFFNESEETQTVKADISSLEAADSENPISELLKSGMKADENVGELVRYNDELFYGDVAPEVSTSLRAVLAAAMEYTDRAAEAYWSRYFLEAHYTQEQLTDNRFSKKDLITVLTVFQTAEAKQALMGQITKLIEGTEEALNTLAENSGVKEDQRRYHSLFRIGKCYEGTGFTPKNEISDFLHDYFAQKVGKTAALSIAGSSFPDEDKLTPSGYLETLREKMAGRTFRAVHDDYILEHDIAFYERYSGEARFAVNGNVMVIDGALFLGKYVKGNPALEARDVR